MAEVKVWIDQDLCTGDGLCTEIVPDIFEMKDDGLAYVKDDEGFVDERVGKAGAHALAVVPELLLESAVEAAEECPGFCIFFDDTE
jgi:ferredoxin